jgi:hypothetical protein
MNLDMNTDTDNDIALDTDIEKATETDKDNLNGIIQKTKILFKKLRILSLN